MKIDGALDKNDVASGSLTTSDASGIWTGASIGVAANVLCTTCDVESDIVCALSDMSTIIDVTTGVGSC